MDNYSIDQKLVYIGINLTSSSGDIKEGDWVDIEETIYEGSFEGVNDARIFLVLCSWIKVHGRHVIIEKLMKLQKKKKSVWLIALSHFAVSEGMLNWSRLIEKIQGEHALVPMKMAKQAAEYKGREEIFKKTGFIISKGSFRVRESDVATPVRLIERNHQYKNRFKYGANWRADIITAIEMGIENPNRISKITGCSYPSAHRVFNEYKLVMSVDSAS